VSDQHLFVAVERSEIPFAHIFYFFGDVLDIGLLESA
jgi:hypothetical protein